MNNNDRSGKWQSNSSIIINKLNDIDILIRSSHFLHFLYHYEHFYVLKERIVVSSCIRSLTWTTVNEKEKSFTFNFTFNFSHFLSFLFFSLLDFLLLTHSLSIIFYFHLYFYFQVINLGNGRPFSLKDFISLVEKCVGKEAKIQVIKEK